MLIFARHFALHDARHTFAIRSTRCLAKLGRIALSFRKTLFALAALQIVNRASILLHQMKSLRHRVQLIDRASRVNILHAMTFDWQILETWKFEAILRPEHYIVWIPKPNAYAPALGTSAEPLIFCFDVRKQAEPQNIAIAYIHHRNEKRNNWIKGIHCEILHFYLESLDHSSPAAEQLAQNLVAATKYSTTTGTWSISLS